MTANEQDQRAERDQRDQRDEQARQPTAAGDLTRRKVVVAGAGTVAAVGLGGAMAANASAGERGREPGGRAPAAEECYLLTTETTEGPYYIDADKLRRDVTEDREGIPLLLRLKVIDAETCRPVRNAAVDIWHCDAAGVYSGYEDMGNGGGGPAPTGEPPTGDPSGPPPGGGHQEPTDDSRYLRGTWRTDWQGFVTFKTVFPGWYRGRCVHIHTKVHVNGEWTDAGYEGGTTCHTGQFFFDEESVLASAVVEPYASNTDDRTTLDEDTIYDGSGTRGGLLKLRYDTRDIARGVRASLTVGVDPEATNDGTGMPPQPGASGSPSAS
ncbi:intradiol ring-cleavage dioxygenase [Streptomyces europaeiscabiei]|uniref:intradiol ring-cleavage dioxygenase n=1 Tax=Streptomyces europaeiscabiei TaxID=146819 RepID=UPI0029A19804|nr:intradiol ring-cleavage dioxygenase [Streptomyces europaeiscabiei]MDX3581155.1 intradiol ring-cleavage dioxygenase [Streptomyces europaeiscabiei]